MKGLDLLKELPSIRVGALKLPPPVIIQRVLQLLRQSLHLQPLIKELLVERESFFLQLIDLRSLRLDNLQFAGQITDLELEKSNVFESLLILDFTLGESRLQNLNLFIE